MRCARRTRAGKTGEDERGGDDGARAWTREGRGGREGWVEDVDRTIVGARA